MDKSKRKVKPTMKAFETMAIVQPDSRQEKTNVALPDDDSVSRAKEFVTENQK